MESNNVTAAVVVIGIIVVLSFVSRRMRMKDSWEGVLEKKQKQYDEGGTTYRLIVKTSQGKKKRISVKRSLFESFTEGDTLVKAVGEYDPRKK